MCNCKSSEMLQKCNCNKEEDGSENYMLFGNLQIIKRALDSILEMDPHKVEEIVKNGHGWAVDHIATSKDDIEEVAGFLLNKVNDHSAEIDKQPTRFVQTFESFNRSYK